MKFETAKRLFDYDPLTGFVYWKIGNGRSVNAGDRAGALDRSSGYRTIGYRGRQYREHRIIWLLVYGVWPPMDIDHINRDRSCNRVDNLRLATPAENSRNRTVSSVSRSGVPGVYWSAEHKKWKSQITVGGKRKFLGLHSSLDKARQVRVAAEAELFGSFSPR